MVQDRNLSHSQVCRLSPLLYVLAFKTFLRKLKANLGIRRISLLGATTSARKQRIRDSDRGGLRLTAMSVGLRVCVCVDDMKIS